MGTFSRLGKNTLLIMLGNASSKVVALLMLPLYTSWLSPEDYGTTDIITVYSTLLLGLVSGCIADAIFVIPKGKERTVIVRYFSTGGYFLVGVFVTTAILTYLLNLIFSLLNISNSFADNIFLIYAVLISNIMFVYCQQFCRSIDKIANYSISGVVVTLATALFSCLLIPKYEVFGFVGSTVLAYISASVYSFFSTKMYSYMDLGCFDREKLKEMLSYSVPLMPNAIMWWLVSSSNRPVLETFCGMSAIGVLAVAGKFPGFLNVLLNSFNSSWLISVLEEYGKGHFSDFYNKGIKYIFFVLLSAAVCITVFSKLLVSIFTSDSAYHEAWIYMPIMSLSIVISCMSGIVGAIFSAVKKSKYYFYSSVWSAIGSIIFNVAFIPVWGVWGAVFASLLSVIVLLTSRFIYAKRYVRFEFSFIYVYNILIYICIALVSLIVRNRIGFAVIVSLISLYLFMNRDALSLFYKRMIITVNSKFNHEK